jgi:hypothetical protein
VNLEYYHDRKPRVPFCYARELRSV